jgi:hypothetical protein
VLLSYGTGGVPINAFPGQDETFGGLSDTVQRRYKPIIMKLLHNMLEQRLRVQALARALNKQDTFATFEWERMIVNQFT